MTPDQASRDVTGGVGPVRAGLLGFGMAGQTLHAPLLATTKGMDLAAIVTADPARRQRARAAYPEAELFDDANALLAAGDRLGLHLVVIATPNRSHVSLARAALAAGFAVVVDKPLATTAPDGQEVVALAEARDRLLSVFHNRRWDGDFLTVRRLVDDGALGRVHRFESRFERWRPRVDAERWRERADPDEGGGVLLDLGSHLVDQALVLFGPVQSVYAEVNVRRPGAAVDDDVFLALSHVGGEISHLWAGALVAAPGPRFRVLGDRAGYVVHGMDVQEAALVAGIRPGGAAWGEAPAEQWGILGAADHFQPVATEPGDYGRFYNGVVAALTTGAPPPVLPSEAISVLEVLDAARLSARAGQVVHLAPR